MDNLEESCVRAKEEVETNSKLWITIVSLAFLTLLTITAIIVVRSHHSKLQQVQVAQTQIVSVAPKVVSTPVPAPVIKTMTATVRTKDSLPKIFKRNGLDPKDATKILALRQAHELVGLHSGKKVNLIVDSTNKKLQQLTYAVDDLTTLTVDNKNGFHAQVVHVEPKVQLEYTSAAINGSIYNSGAKAGLSRKMVAQLVSIFNSKINFNKVRHGDKFAVSYKEYTVNGKKYRDGEIAAAEFTHNNTNYRVVAFADPKGITNYYTPDGMGLKPPFVRYPLKFSHISSRFSLARYQPILGIVRPHYGVDLAAKPGTPVGASSDGKIEFAGRENGYGNVVIVQHGKYSTLYAHLSRFAAQLHSGEVVKQGQIIGYVGETGLATGPHLHYEFRINGVHYDPSAVKLPQGEMIAAEYRKKFLSLSRQMLAQLDLHEHAYAMLATR